MSRHAARERVLQTLFQMDLNRLSPTQAASYTHALLDDEPEADYFDGLLQGVLDKMSFIDELISQYAQDWTMDRMPGVDRNILRIGTYELVFEKDIPDAVVLDEAVELSKQYGTEQSSKFINGVLAGVLRDLEDIKKNVQGMQAT